ncbi:hypothetical protein RhiirA1_477872 [Rhizophagus irregularis]|uniref:Uncharacterized protein n=1 Tax=Rhizophagus irregularis TaxID=588596 RepID=A0A2N0QSW4_9GLOM|nr:hypothetical protein RhiirA1_477872 [Rhizophagus irregularis]
MFFNVSIFILFYRLAAFRTPPGQNFEGKLQNSEQETGVGTGSPISKKPKDKFWTPTSKEEAFRTPISKVISKVSIGAFGTLSVGIGWDLWAEYPLGAVLIRQIVNLDNFWTGRGRDMDGTMSGTLKFWRDMSHVQHCLYQLGPLGGMVLVGTFGQNSIGWDLLGRINFTNVFSFYNLWLPGCFLNGTSKLFVGIEPTGTMSKPLTTNSREKSKLALVFSTEI